MTMAIVPPEVALAGQRAVGLAGILAAEVATLGPGPLAAFRDRGLTPDHLATDLEQALTELRQDLGELVSFARRLGASQAQITAVDERLAHAVPLPRVDHGAVARRLPLEVAELTGTLLAEALVHAAPGDTLRIADPLVALIPDGPGWAVPAQAPEPEATSPGSPAAWFASVSGVQAHAGQISVTHLDNGCWVVSLPGIHALTEAPDPLDLFGAAHAFATGRGAYASAVVMALGLAGVPRGAQIMLVGHSQGGIVGADLAADQAVARRWRITHLLTAASPIDDIPVPAATNVLALRNRDDIVPALDLRPPRAGQTTVTFDEERGSIGANHDLAGTYTPFARSRAFAAAPGVQGWETSAAGYLGGGSATTQRFQLLDRAPKPPAMATTPGRD